MVQTEVERWLSESNPNYTKGIYLLDTFGDGVELPFDRKLLERKTSYTAKKLRVALELVLKSSPTQKPIRAKTPPPKRKGKHVRGETKGYPPHLVELDRNLGVNHSELNSLANKSRDIPEGDELKKMALEIVQRHKDHLFAWRQLDYYAEFEQIMPGTEPSQDSEDDIVAKVCHWLEIQPRLIDYTRRHGKSKDPKKLKEAKKRQAELDKIAEFLRSRKYAD